MPFQCYSQFQASFSCSISAGVGYKDPGPLAAAICRARPFMCSFLRSANHVINNPVCALNRKSVGVYVRVTYLSYAVTSKSMIPGRSERCGTCLLPQSRKPTVQSATKYHTCAPFTARHPSCAHPSKVSKICCSYQREVEQTSPPKAPSAPPPPNTTRQSPPPPPPLPLVTPEDQVKCQCCAGLHQGTFCMSCILKLWHVSVGSLLVRQDGPSLHC